MLDQAIPSLPPPPPPPPDWHNRREGQTSTELRHVVPAKRYMGEAPLVYPVMVYQQQADIAEQQNVIRDPRVSLCQRFRIHLGVTVHGGTSVSNRMSWTLSGTLWALRKWSIKSCGVPFQAVHHNTGHRHN